MLVEARGCLLDPGLGGELLSFSPSWPSIPSIIPRGPLMKTTHRQRVRVLTIILAMPTILALVGCGGQTSSATGANDPTTQSVSSYEAEIAKSKAANSKKAAK